MRQSAVAALLCFATVTHAQPLDRGLLEAYVDGIIETAMEDHRIPGVVISVVQGGEVILEKGYGYARAADRVPADPATSLFRVASITKTFNATALMQLVEQGRVDLDADFTTYLPDVDFDLPHGTVRVRDLITHSAGFEDSYFGHFWAIDDASDHELEAYVRRYQPAQVRAPGDRVVYSNYGTAVIGLIVQQVSGVPYPDYVEQHVLRPLGMERSTLRDWPGDARAGYLSAELETDLAHSGVWSAGRFDAPSWAWAHRGMMPAGGLLSTAREMTYFMRAHLGDGSGILRPESVRRMREPLIRNHDGVAANAHGFWVNSAWGYPTLEHGGSIFGFLSNMVLVPELDLGIFISTNGPPGYGLINALPRRVVGRFHERRIEVPDPVADPETLAEYEGEYLPMRRGYTTIDKMSAFEGSTKVGYNDQGYLTIGAGPGVQRYVPLGDDRFINVDTGDTVAFSRDANGRPVQLHGAYGHNNAERIGFLQSDDYVIVTTLTLVLTLALWLLALGMTRHHRRAESGGERTARRLAHATALIWVVFVVTLMASLSGVMGLTARHFAHFPQGLDWGWIIAGPVAAALSALLLVYAVPVWRDGHWYWTRRVTYTLFALASVALVFGLHTWNLIGLRVL